MARWVCAFCNHPQVYTKDNSSLKSEYLWLAAKESNLTFQAFAVRCLNDLCNETTLTFSVYNYEGGNVGNIGARRGFWQLWPESSSRPQPDYIPEPLRQDYFEACLIRDKSPKASATLSRRCLQGMIRDFCNISESRLIDEINKLRKAVDAGTAPTGVTPETVDAIDSVRSVGNIGAHMERDINIIVEVDPDEAQILISLIELLFEEWYVARHIRSERLARVTALSAAKKAQIAAAKSPPLQKLGTALGLPIE